jgi:hypothetical protein
MKTIGLVFVVFIVLIPPFVVVFDDLSDAFIWPIVLVVRTVKRIKEIWEEEK